MHYPHNSMTLLCLNTTKKMLSHTDFLRYIESWSSSTRGSRVLKQERKDPEWLSWRSRTRFPLESQRVPNETGYNELRHREHQHLVTRASKKWGEARQRWEEGTSMKSSFHIIKVFLAAWPLGVGPKVKWMQIRSISRMMYFDIRTSCAPVLKRLATRVLMLPNQTDSPDCALLKQWLRNSCICLLEPIWCPR